MQREDDRPPSSGRPSLLSQAPQAEPGRASVFDGLDRRPATAAPVASRARKPLLLAGIGAGVLLLAAGVAVWMAAEPEPQLMLAAAPAVKPSPATVAPTAAAAAPAPEVPAATIVEETAAVSPPADSRSLKEVLNDIPPKAPRAELTAALEKPHANAAKPEHKKAEKPASKQVQVARKAEPPKPKAKPQDSDVTLLAALMTHVQTAKGPSKEPSTPAYQLKQCGRLNEAGASQCRAHLCATTASKEPECKQPVAVKTAAES